ncbi:MAG: protease inhibitor I42 family protein [Ardenticatenaceae bacterium]|nr:protease inhibitor I42 family protein [Ardenticatenaceae bacterium]
MNNNKKHIKVNLQEAIEILLEAQSGAGYLWLITEKPNEIRVINKQIIPSGTIGGDALFIFSLICIESGTYTVTFTCKRPWEADFLDQKAFSIEAE